MADAAVGDLDLDVARARGTALDVERFERLVGGVGAECVGGHGSLLGVGEPQG